MTPYEQARAVYDRGGAARSFDEDFEVHMMLGTVHSTPELFIMGRPVWHKAAPEAIVNPYVTFPPELQDCWHIYLMAGDIRKCWDFACDPVLTYVSYEAINELKGPIPMQRVKEIILR